MSSGVPFDVYLEVGSKRVFASAVDWPGWARSGRDKQEALEQLVSYGPRYAKVVKGVGAFDAPGDVKSLRVVEEVKGNSSTDFGAPGQPSSQDHEPVNADQMKFLTSILGASFEALDAAVEAARGKTLAKGPRGGGRDLEKVVDHVWEGNVGYLLSIAGRENLPADIKGENIRKAMKDAVEKCARGELPAQGPRGGQRWTARYFVRRAAWHILDHAWEIEDRSFAS